VLRTPFLLLNNDWNNRGNGLRAIWYYYMWHYVDILLPRCLFCLNSTNILRNNSIWTWGGYSSCGSINWFFRLSLRSDMWLSNTVSYTNVNTYGYADNDCWMQLYYIWKHFIGPTRLYIYKLWWNCDLRFYLWWNFTLCLW